MKNKWLVGAGAVVLLLAFVIGVMQSNGSKAAPRLNEGEVESIVLEQYPGDVKDITRSKSKKDAIYGVELSYNGKDYAIQVDGNSGNIVHVKELGSAVVTEPADDPHKGMLEPENGNEQPQVDVTEVDEPEEVEEPEEKEPADKQEKGKTSQANNSSAILSELEAIDIARSEFPGTVIELEREKNNGRTLYEIELVAEGEKAELEIDAMSGEIVLIKVKADKKGYRKYSGVTLSVEEAIQIAKDKFPGTVIEVELDEDNGEFEYEVELIKDGKKVEIKIDGHTGVITKYDD